ncbi:MAG: tetratricopeptide repeat protein [Candidatus Omnitrophica bacterium]|nr:tetratricopeptide repeat protein [Candidatus Omnitrophota bacterium]
MNNHKNSKVLISIGFMFIASFFLTGILRAENEESMADTNYYSPEVTQEVYNLGPEVTPAFDDSYAVMPSLPQEAPAVAPFSLTEQMPAQQPFLPPAYIDAGGYMQVDNSAQLASFDITNNINPAFPSFSLPQSDVLYATTPLPDMAQLPLPTINAAQYMDPIQTSFGITGPPISIGDPVPGTISAHGYKIPEPPKPDFNGAMSATNLDKMQYEHWLFKGGKPIGDTPYQIDKINNYYPNVMLSAKDVVSPAPAATFTVEQSKPAGGAGDYSIIERAPNTWEVAGRTFNDIREAQRYSGEVYTANRAGSSIPEPPVATFAATFIEEKPAPVATFAATMTKNIPVYAVTNENKNSEMPYLLTDSGVYPSGRRYVYDKNPAPAVPVVATYTYPSGRTYVYDPVPAVASVPVAAVSAPVVAEPVYAPYTRGSAGPADILDNLDQQPLAPALVQAAAVTGPALAAAPAVTPVAPVSKISMPQDDLPYGIPSEALDRLSAAPSVGSGQTNAPAVSSKSIPIVSSPPGVALPQPAAVSPAAPKDKIEQAREGRLTGDSFFMEGKYDEAIREYDRSIGMNPNDAIAFNNRGVAYNNKFDQATAIANFDKAIKLDPGLAETHYNRADALAYLGKNEEAKAGFTEAIKLDPGDSASYNGRAITNYLLHNYDDAWSDVAATQALGGNFQPEFERVLGEASLAAHKSVAALPQPAAVSPVAPAVPTVSAIVPAAAPGPQVELSSPASSTREQKITLENGAVFTIKPEPLTDVHNPINSSDQIIQLKDNNLLIVPDRFWVSPVNKPTADSSQTQTDAKAAQDYYEQGKQLFYARDYQGAVETFTKVLEYEPKNDKALGFRSSANAKLGNIEDARKDRQLAVGLITGKIK